MKIKIKSIIAIIIVFLSTLIIGWNFGFVATNPENDSNSSSDARSNPRSNEDFYCGVIIDENQNLGINRNDMMPKPIETRSLASSPWPMFRNNLNHTGLSPYDTSFNFGKLFWNFTTGGQVRSSPTIGPDGTIYVGSIDFNLYAIYPNGTKKWNFPIGHQVDSSPAIDTDGTIYVGYYNDELYAINPNGTKKWSFMVGGDVSSSPAIGSDGTVYISSGYYDVFAIDPNGTQKWKFTTGSSGVYSSPAIGSNGTIYVGSGDKNLYAINPNGTKKWNFTTGHAVYSSPAIGSDGTIYVGSFDNNLYAINPNGTKKWNFMTGGVIMFSSPAIGSDGTIYVGSNDNNLYAINPNGTKKWSYSTGGWVQSSPAIGSDGAIYVGSYDNNLYAINPDGTKKWNFTTGNDVFSSPSIGSDGSIYVGSNDGNLYAIGSRLTLYSGNVKPLSGYTNTFFNYSVNYLQCSNKPPIYMYVKIDDINYSMNETDTNDVNYGDGKNYYFNITYLDIGLHNYNFWASDGFNSSHTLIFKNPRIYNTPPKITTENNLTAYEDTYYEVRYEYEDIDRENVGQIGHWNFSTNASWLLFDNIIAILNGTPINDDVGSYWVNISINDTVEIDFTNFTLTVLNINDDPLINTTNVEITYEDELYEIDYNATDVDSLIENQLWFLSTNASSWLDIDSATGIISGTPINDDVGDYWVNVSVVDGDNGLDFAYYMLIVLNVNDPPVITTQDVLFANESELYQVDYNATDIDSPISQQIWTIETNATWLSIDPSTGVLSGTPIFSEIFEDENIIAAWWHVNVTVSDGDGGSDRHEFILVVWKNQVINNSPPVITTIDKVSITAGDYYNVIYEANDDRTPVESLIWSYNSNASWLSFSKSTRLLSGLPTLSHVGWYWINVTVNDGEGKLDFHNFTLTVYSIANQPPIITTEDDINAIVGEQYTVDYEATDDRTPIDYLNWSLETNASWLNIDRNTGVLIGTPGSGDIGWYTVNVSVFDGENGWDFHYFILTVTIVPIEENNAPELNDPTILPKEGDTETEFTFTIHYYDLDNDAPIFIQVVIDNKSYNMTLKTSNASNGTYEYSTKLSEGPHTYYFTASDGIDTVSTNNFTITVGDNKVGEKSEESYWFGLIWIVIVIVIVVLILLFVFFKRKKSQEEAPVAPVVSQPAAIEEPIVEEEMEE